VFVGPFSLRWHCRLLQCSRKLELEGRTRVSCADGMRGMSPTAAEPTKLSESILRLRTPNAGVTGPERRF
jgi:hypothetical protein